MCADLALAQWSAQDVGSGGGGSYFQNPNSPKYLNGDNVRAQPTLGAACEFHHMWGPEACLRAPAGVQGQRPWREPRGQSIRKLLGFCPKKICSREYISSIISELLSSQSLSSDDLVT